jgi:hypothetical protein
MKLIKAFTAIALFFAVNTISAQSALEKWPAMHTFHEVMSRSFHPAENGDLSQVRSYSETLMRSAMALTTAEIPKEFKTKTVLGAIDRLQAKTSELHKLVVSKASDEALKKSVTEAHDIFHEIIGLCSEKH